MSYSHTSSRRTETRYPRGVKQVHRNRAKPNYLLLFNLFCVSLLMSGGVSFSLQTSALLVKSINDVSVSGVKLADKSAVDKAAMGAVGKNIILLRKSPVIAKIRTISEIQNVQMGRAFPDKLWIRVKERKPAAILTDSKRYCMVQDNGFMFHAVKGPVKGLPLIAAAKCDPIKPGNFVNASGIRYALEILKIAYSNDISLSKISIDHDADICLNMGGELCVKFGQPDDISKKMSLLRNTLAYKPSIVKDASYIDISCPSAPAWKPKVVAQAAY